MTLWGDWTSRRRSGMDGSAKPTTNAATFAARLPARFTIVIQTSRTGPAGAVSSDEAAAIPAPRPAANGRMSEGRSTALIVRKRAETPPTRQSAYACREWKSMMAVLKPVKTAAAIAQAARHAGGASMRRKTQTAIIATVQDVSNDAAV